ncbi:copper chaperone PCu(A)C [Paracoccus sp. PS-1]|uniref:copper chaperone PCu(A)C n=1 Tax=unclassified Paracoccus (in: a-proteobacteria) TaxID=2688777 RepID=UPI0004B11F28|nr:MULTISPECIES: copper chaperone PCu(A)C [unclassified Paracoccus (in: a-proteobacteria)]MDQ7261113.1 copper chaperone PCu(A)C [Paracoccus sp. PS1]
MKSRILAAPMLGALFLGFLAASASADPVTHGDLLLSDGYVRAMPPNAPVAGGYVTIANNGSQDDRLVAARSPRAGAVQIHEMTMNGDVMKMRELPDGLPVPAGGSVELKPGGYHLMFMQVAEPFAEGETVEATLVFEKAGEIALPFAVRAMNAAPAGHQGHASDHSGH